MKYNISQNSIFEIAEAIVLDYLGDKASTVKCIDIEGLLVDYFKLKIVYENFAEDDPNKDGFIADGVRPIFVWRNRKKESVVFPVGTVVFDKYLLRPEMSSHRRFCFAHEAAHFVFGKENAKVLGNFHCEFDKNYNYSFEELKAMFSMQETQANSMGAAFLIPLFLAIRTLKEYFPRRKYIKLYGEATMLPDDRKRFVDMADQMGVSGVTLMIQLKKYGMVHNANIDDLVKDMKKRGGWGASTGEYNTEISN